MEEQFSLSPSFGKYPPHDGRLEEIDTAIVIQVSREKNIAAYYFSFSSARVQGLLRLLHAPGMHALFILTILLWTAADYAESLGLQIVALLLSTAWWVPHILGTNVDITFKAILSLEPLFLLYVYTRTSLALCLAAKYAWTGRVFNVLGLYLTWLLHSIGDGMQLSRWIRLCFMSWLVLYWISMLVCAHTHLRFHSTVQEAPWNSFNQAIVSVCKNNIFLWRVLWFVMIFLRVPCPATPDSTLVDEIEINPSRFFGDSIWVNIAFMSKDVIMLLAEMLSSKTSHRSMYLKKEVDIQWVDTEDIEMPLRM